MVITDDSDIKYMERAITLAKQGRGWVNPNPLVGAVIVKNHKIIGQGYHEKYGGNHAEVNAIENSRESVEGATLYVTLEPCRHYGKTPPCVDRIIKEKIRRVVIGTLDPNELMQGKSIKILRDHGIEVSEGVLAKECSQMNEFFEKYIKTKVPFVAMKYAMTLDGKIATHTKKSKWITDRPARQQVQDLRKAYMGIMVGVNTIIQDNPQLTYRLTDGNSPIRIICDTYLRTPLDSNVVTTARKVKTIIATGVSQGKEKYEQQGCIVITTKTKNKEVDLQDLMKELGQLKIDSILLEGGGTLNWSALDQKIVDKVYAYIAPKIFGGEALSAVSGQGVSLPDQAIQLDQTVIEKVGCDYLIKGKVMY